MGLWDVRWEVSRAGRVLLMLRMGNDKRNVTHYVLLQFILYYCGCYCGEQVNV